jgi:hypothetical protein
LSERFRFLDSRDSGNEIVLNDGRSFARQGRPKDNHRMRQGGLSKGERFLKVGDTEKLDLTRQRLGYAHKAVPVRVCLYDRKDIGWADPFADNAEIVQQRIAIDLSPATVSFFRAHFFCANPGVAFATVIWGSRR